MSRTALVWLFVALLAAGCNRSAIASREAELQSEITALREQVAGLQEELRSARAEVPAIGAFPATDIFLTHYGGGFTDVPFRFEEMGWAYAAAEVTKAALRASPAASGVTIGNDHPIIAKTQLAPHEIPRSFAFFHFIYERPIYVKVGGVLYETTEFMLTADRDERLYRFWIKGQEDSWVYHDVAADFRGFDDYNQRHLDLFGTLEEDIPSPAPDSNTDRSE